MTNKLSVWLNERFLDWEQQQGRRQTISAFARYLGVPQSSLSSWMAGAYVPSGENLLVIASKLGAEIYEILGLSQPPIPDRELAYIASVWNKLHQKDRDELLASIRTKVESQLP